MLNHHNESRLYLAYYARGSSKPGELPTFHVALLLTPKNPPNTPFFNSNPTPGVVQYHVTNPIDAATRKQVWKYEEKTTFLLRPVAVLLLGKVDAGDEIGTLLRAVPLVQDVPEWRCHSWLWAAINNLVAQDVLEELGGDGEYLWNIGLAFTRAIRDPNVHEPVPTCDLQGRTIESELNAV